MEPDRYQQNKTYYIIGFVCLILSLMFFGLGIYLLPYVAFGWIYSIPNSIFDRIHFIETTYGFSMKAASWLLLLADFLGCFFLALVTYVTSNRIENEILGIAVEPVEVKKETKESYLFILTILLTVGLIFLVAMLFQWVISKG